MNDLLEKYFAEGLTNQEKTALFRQIDLDENLKKEFVRLQNTVAISNMADKQNDDKWILSKFNQIIHTIKKRKQQRLLFTVIKYSAAAVLLFAAWFLSEEYTLSKQSDNFTYIEVPTGQQAFLTLPDGTEVWLASRTKLKYSNVFNQKHRIVELDGEGFFSVYKNTSKPFVVSTKDYNVQATGTQFNVFAYSESTIFETELASGGVSIYHENNKEKRLNLKPNERAFIKEGKLLKSNDLTLIAGNYKTNIYSFEEKPLKELVRRLELWYNVKIVFKTPEVGDFAFNGKFKKTDNIEHVLQAIKDTGKFEYKIIKENDEIQQIEIY